jgi:hypothetical protein
MSAAKSNPPVPILRQGDSCNLSTWNAILPDPQTPGKFRLVKFVIDMRMELLADKVDAQGKSLALAHPS